MFIIFGDFEQDAWASFPFFKSETMRDFYLEIWYMGAASRVIERLKT